MVNSRTNEDSFWKSLNRDGGRDIRACSLSRRDAFAELATDVKSPVCGA